MKNTMAFPQKIKNRTIIKSSNSTSVYIPVENKNTIQKDIWTSMFTAALFTIPKIWKQPESPPQFNGKRHLTHKHTHTYTNKHTHTMEYCSVIKNNPKILPFETTWMDLEDIMLSEISQTKKYKYCISSLICGI